MESKYYRQAEGVILKFIIFLLTLIVTLSGMALLFLIWLDAANPKWVVEKAARTFAGSNLAINGGLNIYVFSLNPGIKAQDIVVKSPSEFIKAEDLEGRLDLGAYLRGKTIITKFDLINGRVNITKNEHKLSTHKSSAMPIGLLAATKSAEIKNIHFNFYKTYSGIIKDLSIRYVAAKGQSNIKGNGMFQSFPIHLHGTVQIDKSKNYPKRPFEIYTQIEQIHAALVGWVSDISHSLNAQLAILTKSPSHIPAAFGLKHDILPPFKFMADLSYQNNTLTSNDYKFLLGKTYAYGDFTLRRGKITFISMDTTFNPLRYEDIENLIKINNQLKAGAKENTKERNGRKVNFNNPLPFNILHKFEGNIKIYIKEYQSPKPDFLFKAGILKANLKEEHLNLISAAKIAKGIIAARVDAIAAKVPRLDTTVKISKINIADLTQGTISKVSSEEQLQPKSIGGKLDGYAKLKSSGYSPEDLISHLSGKIKMIMQEGYIGSLTDVNAQLSILAKNPNHIHTIFDLNSAPLSPVKLIADLAYQNNTLTTNDYKLSLGKTYAYGNFSFRRGRVPFISMDTTFNPLRYADIEKLTKVKEQLTGAPHKEKKHSGKKSFINNNPVPFNILHKFEGDVKIYIKEYQSPHPSLLFKSGIIKANLEEGRLKLLSAAKIAKGIIAVRVGAIAEKIAHLDAIIKVSRVDVTAFAKKAVHQKPPAPLKPKKVIGGRLDGFAELKSKGYSTKDFIDHLDGNMKLAMGSGHVGSLITTALSLHIPEAVISWIQKNPPNDINCMLVTNKINNGKVNTPTILISSNKANIIGSGTANLRKETLRYTFRSFPKDFSIKAGLPTVVIEGNFLHPKLGVTTKHVILTAIDAILEPIVANIEDVFTNINSNEKCRKLFDEIKRIQKKSKISPSTVKAVKKL
ncbi:MAG: hypothetical protein ACU4EQ_11950 [Candidatus Nitrosoglobus sp.]